MRNTGRDNIVQPKTTYLYLLDDDKKGFYNFRLNNKGRNIVSRIHSDNERMLLTDPGFNLLRHAGVLAVKKEKYFDKGQEKERNVTEFNPKEVTNFVVELFYSIVQLESYPDDIAKIYKDVEEISWRSIYIAKQYFMNLNGYGHNSGVILDDMIILAITRYLNTKFKAWFENPKFEMTIEQAFDEGKWLTHIKNNVLSGYASNIQQSKQSVSQNISASIKVFKRYVAKEKIDWKKLAFEMGYRSERKKKIRTVCMASDVEKPLSALFSAFLDSIVETCPINLARKWGPFDNLVADFSKHFSDKVRGIAADFHAYDTSIPVHLMRVVLDWLKGIHQNLFVQLLSFEIELCINAVMIVGPTTYFNLQSLPSGIGITQFFGSLLHDIIDFVAGLTYTLVSYQSDDNLGLTNLTDSEISSSFKKIKDIFGMEVAPIGPKTFVSDRFGKYLQKVIDLKLGVSFNSEIRAFTNAFFRERALTDDMLFELVFLDDFSDAEGKSKKGILAMLGNLSSFGQYAPSFPRILPLFYGKERCGYTQKMLEWGLRNLEPYMQNYLNLETHRPVVTTGFLKGLIEELVVSKGWKTISDEDVIRAYDKIGAKRYILN